MEFHVASIIAKTPDSGVTLILQAVARERERQAGPTNWPGKLAGE